MNRFNNTTVNRLKDFYCPNITVEYADFKDSLQRHPNIFAYLDPPYLKTVNYYYGNNGDTHKNFDHTELRDMITNRDNWVMSYNEIPEILSMYKEHKFVRLSWHYGMDKGTKNGKELLIFSKNLSHLADEATNS